MYQVCARDYPNPLNHNKIRGEAFILPLPYDVNQSHYSQFYLIFEPKRSSNSSVR